MSVLLRNMLLPGSGALLSLVALGGCFFTEVVNEAPIAGIRTLDEGLVYKGNRLSFNATKTVDDITTGLTCEWRAFTCPPGQSENCTPFGDVEIGAVNYVFTVDVESHDSIVVQLRVTDELGATRQQPDLLTVDVGNRPPSVDLQVSGSTEGVSGQYILYRPIDLVVIPGPAVGPGTLYDPDNDTVDLSWRLLPPANSQESARSFTQVGDEGYILVPDVSGMWSIVLTADDGFGGIDEVRRDFFVGEDAPPCLQSLDPIAHTEGFYLVESTDGPRAFSVLSVVDALDPFPASPEADDVGGEATFKWLLREPGATSFTTIEGYGDESYTIDPLAYEPGDLLELRVEAQDRITGPERDLACAEDSRACALVTGSECFQRQTWGVQIQ